VRVWKIAGVQCVILYFQHQNKDHLLLLPRGKASNKQAAGSKINKMLFGEREHLATFICIRKHLIVGNAAAKT
jgi:hypothetical protein